MRELRTLQNMVDAPLSASHCCTTRTVGDKAQTRMGTEWRFSYRHVPWSSYLSRVLTAAPQDPARRLCFVCLTSSSQLLLAATSKRSPARIPAPLNHAAAVRGHSSSAPRHLSSRLLHIRSLTTSLPGCR